MKKINFMCIDPSKACIGIFIKDSGSQVLDSVKSRSKDQEGSIYPNIFNKIDMHICASLVDLIFIEENAFSGFNKSRSPSKLAEVIGIIKVAAYKANPRIIIIPISNSLWKGILKGYPFINTKKNKKYLESGRKLLKQDFQTCDEVDAFCIGVAMNTLYKKYGFTDAQIRMKEKIHDAVDRIKRQKLELF
jgi:hypothetical protein